MGKRNKQYHYGEKPSSEVHFGFSPCLQLSKEIIHVKTIIRKEYNVTADEDKIVYLCAVAQCDFSNDFWSLFWIVQFMHFVFMLNVFLKTFEFEPLTSVLTRMSKKIALSLFCNEEWNGSLCVECNKIFNGSSFIGGWVVCACLHCKSHIRIEISSF